MSDPSLYRKLPAVDGLLQQEELQSLLQQYPRSLVLSEIQRTLTALRAQIQQGMDSGVLEARLSQLQEEIRLGIEGRLTPGLVRVINATGVVVHTNLGRAPVDEGAIDFVRQIATGYCNLEYDLDTGQRGHRERHIESLMEQLVGRPVGAAVVNNNAAAVMLILDTFAQGGEVLVSRGELVEIGGSFRIPDILEKSGARLREVGTTNKTRIEDYEQAIRPETRLILRVHPSNFQIVGFTERPSMSDLVAVAARHGLPLVEDLGSGLLCESSGPLQNEPTARQSIEAGAGLVCFSGDKLLGATQAGIVIGAPELVKQVRTNPLMRALRVDKTAYAILVYSLHRYLSGRADSLPIYRFLSQPIETIRQREVGILQRLKTATAELRESFSLVGGGSAPEVRIPTFVLAAKIQGVSADALHGLLRRNDPPIVARIEDDWVVFDLRTVLPDQDPMIVDALNACPAGEVRSA